MGFLLGLIVGMILSPILLVLISKPLMKWFVRRQANKLISNVTDKLSGLQNQFQTNNDGEENSESKRKQ